MIFAILLLSVIGLFLSIIFYAVDHNKLPSLRKYTGFICNETICQSVLRLDDSELFWVKNYLIGGLYFLGTLLLSLLYVTTENHLFTSLIGFFSALSVYSAVFLFYRLVFVHKINCVFCFTGHLTVVLILILSIFAK